jgi:hypothetical protein
LERVLVVVVEMRRGLSLKNQENKEEGGVCSCGGPCGDGYGCGKFEKLKKQGGIRHNTLGACFGK